jgi:DNA mismatch repair protein MutS2
MIPVRPRRRRWLTDQPARGIVNAMATRFAPGDAVQTPHGKGVVREVRNNRRLLVQVQERSLVVAESDVTAATAPRRPAAHRVAAAADEPRSGAPTEVDLHGLHVDESLARIDAALDAALRAGDREVRFIHGRSGGRLRGALHGRLRQIAAVREFRLDPRNPGVTIVSL